MENIDLFEVPKYTVHVNGLFGLVTKASVTKKFTGPGLLSQIEGGPRVHYDTLTRERLEEVITEVFSQGSGARGRHSNIQFQEEVGQFPTNYAAGIDAATPGVGSTTFSLTLNEDFQPGTSLVERMMPHQHTYDIMMARVEAELLREMDRVGSSPESQLPQEPTQQQLLLTRLQRGEINQFEYLDQISEL